MRQHSRCWESTKTDGVLGREVGWRLVPCKGQAEQRRPFWAMFLQLTLK